MVDIDHFKAINERYGHQCGDSVLKHISKVVGSHFRSSDAVSRFGGEEFCILATNMEEDRCKRHYEGLRSAVENGHIHHAGENVSATVSIGVTATLAESLEATIQTADKLLYKAKKDGRNRLCME